MSSMSDDRQKLTRMLAISYNGIHEQMTAAEIKAEAERDNSIIAYRADTDELMQALFAIIGTQKAGYRVEEKQVATVKIWWTAYQKSRNEMVRVHGKEKEESIRRQEGVIAELFAMAGFSFKRS